MAQRQVENRKFSKYNEICHYFKPTGDLKTNFLRYVIPRLTPLEIDTRYLFDTTTIQLIRIVEESARKGYEFYNNFAAHIDVVKLTNV